MGGIKIKIEFLCKNVGILGNKANLNDFLNNYAKPWGFVIAERKVSAVPHLYNEMSNFW
jgi:hypothetical protein